MNPFCYCSAQRHTRRRVNCRITARQPTSTYFHVPFLLFKPSDLVSYVVMRGKWLSCTALVTLCAPFVAATGSEELLAEAEALQGTLQANYRSLRTYLMN